ncbi:MetS family NSS transporter small subunit [Virgibacillus sediminis]|uniref:MetS family NSS transporter small subunit n=1 Tax=Virgibacillus sediminis TaxID=202260 RepID=A0ABV7A2T2_9BACI
MSAGAITVMIIGMTVIWGGLAGSIGYAIKKGKESK